MMKKEYDSIRSLCFTIYNKVALSDLSVEDKVRINNEVVMIMNLLERAYVKWLDSRKKS